MSRSKLDDFDVIRTIGRGAGTKVKLVQEPKSQNFFAAKIIKQRDDPLYALLRDAVLRETESLSRISHPNVVSIENWNLRGLYEKKDDKGSYHCMYILIELCANGELFDIICKTGKLSEEIARGLFHQLIEGLEACHSVGITHRDLKCENILFDEYFTLKIADFGFSAVVADRDGQFRTKGKNELYMAPEMHALQPYNCYSIDLFAAGVILFIMVTKDPPFQRAISNDLYYRHLSSRDPKFWSLHRRVHYSDNFKSFIEGILASDPSQRFDINAIKSHPWFTDTAASFDQISNELEIKKQQALELAEKEKNLRLAAGNRAGILYNRGRFYRGDISESSEGLSLSFSTTELLTTQKVSESFHLINKYSQIITGLLPHEVMKIISHTLVDFDAECEVSSETYKVKVSIVTETDNLVFKISILESYDDLYLVIFKLEYGSQFEFMPIFNSIVEQINTAGDE